MYQIIDSKLDSTLGLPSGGNYDVPLVLTSHYFTKDGGMSDERRQQSSIYGDTYLVNGQIQPYLAVEPRKYRFRILNAAISRVFNLTLLDGTTTLPMSIIGSDGGYRQTPSTTKNLMIGMADRWEIILDFSGFSGKNLTLQTTNAWTDTAYSDVDQMMRFVVGKNVSDQTGNSPLPRRFNFNMKFSTETKIAAERVFKLDSHHSDTVWGINGIHHDDAMSRSVHFHSLIYTCRVDEMSQSDDASPSWDNREIYFQELRPWTSDGCQLCGPHAESQFFRGSSRHVGHASSECS